MWGLWHGDYLSTLGDVLLCFLSYINRLISYVYCACKSRIHRLQGLEQARSLGPHRRHPVLGRILLLLRRDLDPSLMEKVQIGFILNCEGTGEQVRAGYAGPAQLPTPALPVQHLHSLFADPAHERKHMCICVLIENLLLYQELVFAQDVVLNESLHRRLLDLLVHWDYAGVFHNLCEVLTGRLEGLA